MTLNNSTKAGAFLHDVQSPEESSARDGPLPELPGYFSGADPDAGAGS